MVRKTVFTREDVILAAVGVIDEDGFIQLTARKVADKLGASTAPVYSNFSTMDELAVAAKMASVEIMMELMEDPEKNLEFINIGEGVLLFAKNHPHLYDALFLQPATDQDIGQQIMDRILTKMETLPELEPLQPVERIILLKKVALFTHGMATEICHGFLDHYQWRELLLLLREVGDALVKASFESPLRKEEDMDLLGTFWSKCSGPSTPLVASQNEGEKDE